MIQGFCMTLMLQTGSLQTPGSCLILFWPKSHSFIYPLYCNETGFIRVVGYGKTYCRIYWMIQAACMTLKPQKWVRQIPWGRLIVSLMIKISHLISFSLLWNFFSYGFGGIWQLIKATFSWGLYMTPMPNATKRYLGDQKSTNRYLGDPWRSPHSIF